MRDSLLLALKAMLWVAALNVLMAGCVGCNLMFPGVLLKPVAMGLIALLRVAVELAVGLVRLLVEIAVGILGELVGG